MNSCHALRCVLDAEALVLTCSVSEGMVKSTGRRTGNMYATQGALAALQANGTSGSTGSPGTPGGMQMCLQFFRSKPFTC